MKKYLCILFLLFTCGTSVFSQQSFDSKSVFQEKMNTVVRGRTLPNIDIRLYEHEHVPLSDTRFIANVLYKLVIQPDNGDMGSYYIYWKLLDQYGGVVSTQNLYCGFHLGIFGIIAPEPGNYTVEVKIETSDKLQSVTTSVPIVMHDSYYTK